MSHHNEGEKKTKTAQPDAEEAVKGTAADGGESTDEQDVEGHNLFSMSDYYVQSKMGRQSDLERDAKQRAQVKEARQNKPEKR
ncbi:MAG: hypothetical protein ABIP53_12155 [Candidatus Limnocylindrales bacterium]